MKVLFPVEEFTVEPLGVAYLAASLRKSGHEPELLKINNNGFLKELDTIRPDIVAFSVTTGKHRKFLELARKIKSKYWVMTFFGGAHPTYFPEILNDPAVDVVIRGEAEKAIVESLDDLQTKKSCRKLVEFRTLEQDIDRIPFPDREFLYKYPENRNNPIKNVITSRGCRFSCPYCFNSIYRDFYKGQTWVRFRSPENVVKECLELKENYPLKFIFFQDDEFLSNPKLDELLDQYRHKVGIPFHCQIRIELLTKEKAIALKSAGCTGVTFAVECGDEWMRKNVLERNMTNDQITKGAEILRSHRLKFRTENMLGLPGESLYQMLATVGLNFRLRPTVAWASIFQPYPRLPLGEYAKKNGFWDGKNGYGETFFETTVLQTTIKKEIVNLQRLFGVAVRFPLVYKFLKTLIKIPNNKFYDKLSKWFKQRQYDRLFC